MGECVITRRGRQVALFTMTPGEDLDSLGHAGKEPPVVQFAGAAKDHFLGFERAFGHLTGPGLVNHAAEF